MRTTALICGLATICATSLAFTQVSAPNAQIVPQGPQASPPAAPSADVNKPPCPKKYVLVRVILDDKRANGEYHRRLPAPGTLVGDRLVSAVDVSNDPGVQGGNYALHQFEPIVQADNTVARTGDGYYSDPI